MKKLFIFIPIAIFLFASCYPEKADALPGVRTWQATWTANTEPDLDGYYLYWRTSSGAFNDTNRIRCAKSATSQVLTGIVPNNTIIALTAVDTSGNESGFSAEVPFAKDGTAPSSPTGLAVVPVP